MATESRGTDPALDTAPLDEVLFEEGYRFDFFQAVRLLERLYPERQPVGRDANPATEAVRFHSHLSLSFPPSAIYDVARAEAGDGPAQMTVAFMGLTGPLGVLPRHYTELLLERLRRKDETLRDFLDLFNHRLISLFYRAWEKYRFPIAYERAVRKREGEDRFTRHMFDLIGLGTRGLRGRLEVEDEPLLFYAGLLAQHPRSASALAGLLQDYFGLPVAVRQFLGQWLPLTVANRSRLGGHEANNALGVSAVAGQRVWDQQATFGLQLGPLTFSEFCQFLPSGEGFRALVALTRFAAGEEYDFDVQLILQAAEVPWCRLGGGGEPGMQLGWSTWLKSREFTADATEARFTADLSGAGGPSAGNTGPTSRGRR